jgi:hypothetical protein
MGLGIPPGTHRVTSVTPVSTAVSAMNADRHQHHHGEPRHERAHAPAEDLAPAEEAAADAAFAAPPAPEPQAPPEGVFAASQLAERLRLLEINLRAISAGQRPWAPPQSDLNLRDRTV